MSWIDGARQRLRELLFPSRIAAETDEELRDHLQREIARQNASHPNTDEARRAAALVAGSLASARDAAADGGTGRVLMDLVRDLRFGLRGMRRSPALSAAVVVSLALGVAGTAGVFTVVHAVLLRPLPYVESDQLHTIRIWWKDFSASLSPADFVALTRESPLAGRIGAYNWPTGGGFAMATASGPQVVKGAFITPELPGVLRVTPALGPGFSANTGEDEALISDRLWREHFNGRSDVIGQTVTLEGEATTVVGVMPAGFNLPGGHDERIWVRGRFNEPTRRGPFFLTTLVRLPPDSTAAAAQTALTQAVGPILRNRYGVEATWRYGLQPLKDVVVGETRETLLLLFAAVGLVLLIALANVANLLLARGTVRVREIAVRASLGAGRARLVRQLLAESALFGLAGGVAGLVLAVGIVDVVRTQAATLLPRLGEIRVDATVAAFALGCGLLAGIGAGVLPVCRLPWSRLNEWLHAGGRGRGDDRRHGRVRQALVVAEIALALTVITSAGLLVKTLVRLQQVDPGLDDAGVFSFHLILPDEPYERPERMGAFLDSLERRLREQSGIDSVAFAMSLPPDLLVLTNNYTVEGAARDSAGPSGVAEWNVVSPEFFSSLRIPILRGRAFGAIDQATSPRVGVVNAAFVRRHFPDQDPIGRRIKGGDWSPQSPWITIVGVAGDVPYQNGAMGGVNPTMYMPYAQNLWWQAPYVLIKTEREDAGLPNAVRAVVTALDPRVPIRDPATMTERLHRSTSIPRLRAVLFSTLGVLALLLGVTGIYGVMAYHVDQRRRETAIRRALGARADRIVLTTLIAGLRLAGAGIVIGTVGALALTQSLSTLLYGVNPRDPLVLSGTMTLLVAAAVIACLWPARRAARVDPATLLRED